MVKFIELGAFLLALTSAMAFSSKHHIIGIWLGVAAGCVALIGFGVWLTFGENKPQQQPTIPGPDTTSVPLVITPADLPLAPSPAIQQPEESTAMNLPQQNVTINTTNQQGNNTGIVNNFAPQPRSISNAQAEQIAHELEAAPKDQVYFIVENTAQDGVQYANILAKVLTKAGYPVLGNGGTISGFSPYENITVLSSPPNSPNIDLLVNALNDAKIPAKKDGRHPAGMGTIMRPQPTGLIIIVGRTTPSA
jgi:hypothetical protein